MKSYLSKCLVLLVFAINYTYSQEFIPPIQNFSPAQYSAASQNWDISIDDRGVIYAANNQGLLSFDGLSWELFPLESQSIIRSVYPHKGRVYTGSYKEFGYWERKKNGSMDYTSLTPLMADLNMQSDEFWEIMHLNDSIYFRSFAGVYKYDGERITTIQNVVSTTLGKYQEKLILAPRKQGLVYVNGAGKTDVLPGDQAILKDVNIIDVESRGDTLYIAGKEALYTYIDGNFREFWDDSLNRLLERSELNHIISISSDEIILGTIKKGIIHYKIREKGFQIYNRTSGLQNNTTLGMTYDKGRLWLALDKGVDMIDLHAPIRFYTDNTGELGAVYDIQKYREDYYIASNTGVYHFSNGQIKLIENAEDHAWNLELIDNVLYANHNTGIYKVINNEFIPIEARTGSFSIKKIPNNSGRLLVSHYTGISMYDPEDKTIQELDLNFPVKEMIFENSGTLWAAHPYEGIYRINHTDYTALEINKVPPLGGKANFNPKIYQINGQIIIYVNEHWFKYNPFKDHFDRFTEMANYRDSRLVYQDRAGYVLANSNEGSLIITNLKDEEIIIPAKKLNNRLVRSNENVIRENDSIFYVTLNDGFAEVNLQKLRKQHNQQWLSSPFVKEFTNNGERFSLADSPVLPFNNSRDINLSAAMPVSDAIELIYSLKGEETLSGNIKEGSLNLRNLKHGDYQLELSALGTNGSSSVEEYFFTISPPWYFSVWMKTFYILLFISLIAFVYWLNQQKLRKHQLQLEEKFEKEHAERLNKIEKERLMNEIDLKRKELANTTMMAAKKNEVLMEIQGELSKDKNKFSNQFRLKHIMNKINSAVKSKDEWKVFETNFNEVHEDFFKDILEKYPKLTNKDLKLCSYLKMNLSSKEIAPLMGISVRGVEVHRYRLRKKMDLESDMNLTKFLIQNF